MTEPRAQPYKPSPWATGFVTVTTLLILYAILLPWLSGARVGHRPQAISHLKQIGLGLVLYAGDFDDRLPDADKWMDAINPYIVNERRLVDPTLKEPKPGQYGFAFYLHLSRVDIETVADHDQVPLAFQSSDLRRNAAGDLSLLPKPPRSDDMNAVVFLDTHVKRIPPEWPTAPIVVEIYIPLGRVD